MRLWSNPGARHSSLIVTCRRLLVVAGLFLLAPCADAQTVSSKPAVFVREVQIDSILLAFGVDSTQVRAAVVNVLREARRLAPTPGDRVPSLDVDVTALRTAFGGMPEPRGFVRVEVGRNLMEAGASQALVWVGTQDLATSPTWRELSRGTLATVLRVVNNYLLGRSGGA